MIFAYFKVLRQDIRGVHQGRGNLQPVAGKEDEKTSSSGGGSVYNCRLDNISLDFITTCKGIEVIKATY